MSNLKDNEGFEVRVIGNTNTDYRGKVSFANRWSTTALQENKWYHLAFTYDDMGGDNNELTLYINGFKDAVYSNVGRIRNTCSCRVPLGELFLGSSEYLNADPNENFQGKMDELRIWSEVRTNEQIFGMYDSTLIDTSTNLVATFDFNEGNTDHIHSLTGKISAQGELQNMNLTEAWTKIDGSYSLNTFNEITAEDICGTYTSNSGTVYTEDGTYIEVFSNNSGCDSTVRLNLSFGSTLNQSLADIEVNGNSFSAASPSTLRGFNWYNCDKPELGVLSTETAFTPTESGNYKLHVTLNGWCPAISECIEMELINTSTQGSTNLDKLTLFPNPTNGLTTIDFGYRFNNIAVQVYSITGELVQNVQLSAASNAVINIANKPGVYFLHIKSDDGLKTTLKVIKK